MSAARVADRSKGHAYTASEMLSKVDRLAVKAQKWMSDNPLQIRESAAVYSFLQSEFGRDSVTGNPVFQFVYRSFYRLDNAGLNPDFHKIYFGLMEKLRGACDLDLRDLVLTLSDKELSRKKVETYQFSFVTKLAHTVNPNGYPIYDSEIGRAFEFRPPHNKDPIKRLDRNFQFYEILRQLYIPLGVEIPQTKLIDFIFWSAGKQIGKGALTN
jgi:hypothetical protein